MNGQPQVVDFWFDPLCPWAWLASRWLLAVEQVRPVRTCFHVMSLDILDEESVEQPAGYREKPQPGWIGVRAAIGVELQHGPLGLRDFYTALGTRYHLRGEPKGNIDVVRAALAECGFDPAIADAAADGAWDAELRASHHAGMDPVGQDVGTPVLHINGKAMFGPVISPAPKGEQAGLLFDGVSLVTTTDGFFELKRSRDRGPIFD